MPNTLLVTGGAGFIGSHFLNHVRATQPDAHLVNVDKLTYAANPDNVASFRGDPNYEFHALDVCDAKAMADRMANCDAVVHFAAESHVDNSIASDAAFMRTNILGTHAMLKAALDCSIQTFVHISTDEVYGSLETGYAKEDDVLRPSSPYSASKAAADELCHAYAYTFGLDVRIVRSVNNFGSRQHPEKLIPKTITRALENQAIPVYGSGKQKRNWIDVTENARAIDTVLRKGKKGETYNVAAHAELENLDVVHRILDTLGKPASLIHHVEDRPGHDFRYAVDDAKIKKLGFKANDDFDGQLKRTVAWYAKNPTWWKHAQDAGGRPSLPG